MLEVGEQRGEPVGRLILTSPAEPAGRDRQVESLTVERHEHVRRERFETVEQLRAQRSFGIGRWGLSEDDCRLVGLALGTGAGSLDGHRDGQQLEVTGVVEVGRSLPPAPARPSRGPTRPRSGR